MRETVRIGVCTAFPILLFLAAGVWIEATKNLAFAQQPQLPTTEEFQGALATCATGLDVTVNADLLGSISSIYNGQRSNGAASFKTLTRFLELFPEADRAKVYELYTKCIANIISPRSSPNAQIPSPLPTKLTSSLEEHAIQFAYDFMDRGGMPVDQMIQFVTNHYANEVLYYTHGYVDRNTIIRDKGRYIQNWPTRSYTVLPGVSARCSPSGDCLVEGNVKYKLVGGYRETCGIASFTLGLSFYSGSPILTREQGEAHNQTCS